jgi:hypothetical protein
MAFIHWQQGLSRGDTGWQVGTDAVVQMKATAEVLEMKATLVAREGDTEVFRREWSETVPRLWL